MQGPIAQALALTCVGNASLQARDVAGFWPNAQVFRFAKSCDFRVVDDAGDRLIAPDPSAWFETLRGGCGGLRLHNAPRPAAPGQGSIIEERMLVGFVGGGPAWLIEAVGVKRSRLWQGFDRLGDRDDSNQKIWLNTYLLCGETEPQAFSVEPLAVATKVLGEVLQEIEILARNIQADNFAECFRAARAALSAQTIAANRFLDDFVGYGGFDLERQRALQAILDAWVFGAMGSWNDIGAPAQYAANSDRLSEQLFRTLNECICALANSTYSAAS